MKSITKFLNHEFTNNNTNTNFNKNFNPIASGESSTEPRSLGRLIFRSVDIRFVNNSLIPP